jgi:hypothetical protein
MQSKIDPLVDDNETFYPFNVDLHMLNKNMWKKL